MLKINDDLWMVAEHQSAPSIKATAMSVLRQLERGEPVTLYGVYYDKKLSARDGLKFIKAEIGADLFEKINFDSGEVKINKVILTDAKLFLTLNAAQSQARKIIHKQRDVYDKILSDIGKVKVSNIAEYFV